MTYKLLLNGALKLVEEIILYYDARSKKHQNKSEHLISRLPYFPPYTWEMQLRTDWYVSK